MELLRRSIPVQPERQVSSRWAVPPGWQAEVALILAHGAGNDMEHPFLCTVQEGLAERGRLVVSFNFPYKEAGRKAPDRAPVLEATWQAVIQAVSEDQVLAPERLVLGGKSLGGRMAAHVAASGARCDGLVFLGYPLHPPGRPESPRTEALTASSCLMLFVEGTRDRLCRLDQLRPLLDGLTAPTTLHEIEGGDHSFKVPARLGRSEEAVWAEIVQVIDHWLSNALERD